MYKITNTLINNTDNWINKHFFNCFRRYLSKNPRFIFALSVFRGYLLTPCTDRYPSPPFVDNVANISSCQLFLRELLLSIHVSSRKTGLNDESIFIVGIFFRKSCSFKSNISLASLSLYFLTLLTLEMHQIYHC